MMDGWILSTVKGWASKVLGAVSALAVLVAVSGLPEAHAYEVAGTISPQLTATPIQLVIWVKPGVTPEDEARTIADILTGVDLWEQVPTACISFELNRIVHSATVPAKAASELLITVGNQGDLVANTGIAPSAGNPGSWPGAIANIPTLPMVRVAAHEIGHAIGFNHSSVSELYPEATHPIMHWRTSRPTNDLAPDDIAAVSVAYPCASAPLEAVTGRVRGRLVFLGRVISGVNVVAVNVNTGLPTVGRITGQLDQSFGTFDLRGVPPGTYRLEYRDGSTYQGGRYSVSGGPLPFGGFQQDNFAPFNSAQFTVAANQTVDVGDIPIEIWDLGVDSPSLGNWLPPAALGAPYEVLLRVRGGVRDIQASSIVGAPGLQGSVIGDPSVRTDWYTGRTFLRVAGTPTSPGVYNIRFSISDLIGGTKELSYFLQVTPFTARHVLFSAGGKAGALGGRSGADAFCQAATRPAGVPAALPTRAFISVSDSDEIRDFPALHATRTGITIVGPNGSTLASNWADLLDGSIFLSLNTAQVLNPLESNWYSGSNSDGSLSLAFCAGWASANPVFRGTCGLNTATAGGWINSANMSCGDPTKAVVCLAEWPHETSTAPALRLFSAGGKAGALGGRAGADALCRAAPRPAQIPRNHQIRAFISVDVNDEIQDFPKKYGVRTDIPILGPTGAKVADDWADLFDGSLDLSLFQAAVFGSSQTLWYSGSTASGSVFLPSTCLNWTRASAGSGGVGSAQSSSASWIMTGTSGTCGDAATHVLCVAY